MGAVLMAGKAKPKSRHPKLTNEEVDALDQVIALEERERSERESWNFAIVGQDSGDVPKFIAWANTKEGVRQLRKNAETLGWRKVTVYDASLTEVKGDD